VLEVDAERRAAVALDEIRASHRQFDRAQRRPSAISARDALAAVHFECLVLWTAWANLLNGEELSLEDHERVSVAMARILAVYEEAGR
jgi:hypothetical protein